MMKYKNIETGVILEPATDEVARLLEQGRYIQVSEKSEPLKREPKQKPVKR